MSSLSVFLSTFLLSRLMHKWLNTTETDNYQSWLSETERIAVEKIPWSIDPTGNEYLTQKHIRLGYRDWRRAHWLTLLCTDLYSRFDKHIYEKRACRMWLKSVFYINILKKKRKPGWNGSFPVIRSVPVPSGKFTHPLFTVSFFSCDAIGTSWTIYVGKDMQMGKDAQKTGRDTQRQFIRAKTLRRKFLRLFFFFFFIIL